MSYKFDGKRVFATYSQIGELGTAAVVEHLQSIKPLLWYRVAVESHADGGRHIHIVGQWTTRVQSRNARFLDVQGIHPNIQSPRDIKATITYVGKDGEFVDYGPVPSNEKLSGNEWVELAKRSTRSEFMAAAFDAGITQTWARELWDLGSAMQAPEIGETYEHDINWECEQLRNLALPENSCAVLVGPSGCGKSAWAKRVAPKPALWVSHMDVLRMFRPNYHASIIFDDMCFNHMPLQAQIHLVDVIDARQIHCRYGYATIPAKTVKIFTCNEQPFVDHAAVNRRITLINLY